jgi:hypothetical protein
MKGKAKRLPSLALLLAAALAGAAQAQPAVNDWGPPTAPTTPRLAAGVQTAPAYYTPAEPYVAAVDTPVYLDMNVYGRPSGQELKRGQKVDVLAYTQQGHWLLVGRNGEGVGYVPRARVTPERYARDLPNWG